jgi:iron-sulfur cluster repair protein YtfE (RIC family)
MTLNTTKTVREVALEMPAATRVFERLKIDYCCGGGKRIDAACADAGVTLNELSALLEEAGASRAGAARDFQLPEGACMSFRALYDALEAFERDLHQHIHLENNVLFPRAVALEEAAF